MQYHTALCTDQPPRWQLDAAPAARLPPVRPLPRRPAHAVRISLPGKHARPLLHPTLLPRPCAPALQRPTAVLCRQNGPTQQGTKHALHGPRVTLGSTGAVGAAARHHPTLHACAPCLPVHTSPCAAMHTVVPCSCDSLPTVVTTLPCMPVRPVYLYTRLPVRRGHAPLWSPAAATPC